ncbi:DUF1127 domain-containing protein [Mesorhizobium loti]|uniref:DUF1127 domain-containing protein n=1 Tax=Rhizobium loti TaxID=381 RepID=UPI00041B7A50|nr:DUF1127 domain-containing protein [Mesorhizobium loti]
MTNCLALASRQAVLRCAPGEQASPRRYSLAALRSTIAASRARARFRWDLKRISEANPHLIDDIGLTMRQVEEEIAKLPFWQR